MTAYKNAVLIYNPRAGRFERKAGAVVKRAADILTRQGHHITVAPTTGPSTAGAIAHRYVEAGADLVIAAGGDGTINEVAQGLVHTDVPLAILPGGTANVLAMEMKLGKDIDRVAARISEMLPRRISLGHVTCDGGRTQRHFLLMAGIGLDAHVVYNVSGALKSRTGKFAYWVAGWKVLGRKLPQIEIEIDTERRNCSFALLSKVRNYGGDFEIARSVSLLDDRFEAVLFEGRSSFRYMKYLVGVALRRLNGMKGVTVARLHEASLRSADRRVYVQIDGEFVGHLPAEVRIVPDALTLLVPEDYGAG